MQKKIISVQLDELIIEVLEKLAEENYRTLSSQIRFILDKYVQDICNIKEDE